MVPQSRLWRESARFGEIRGRNLRTHTERKEDGGAMHISLSALVTDE
jgi:hypothetical protein